MTTKQIKIMDGAMFKRWSCDEEWEPMTTKEIILEYADLQYRFDRMAEEGKGGIRESTV